MLSEENKIFLSSDGIIEFTNAERSVLKMPSGEDIRGAVHWAACELKDLGVSASQITDVCPPNLDPNAIWSFIAVLLCVLGGLCYGGRKLYCWYHKKRKCIKALKPIKNSPGNKEKLCLMTRKDCKIQGEYWMESLMETESEKEFQELKEKFIHKFYLADDLADRYSFH